MDIIPFATELQELRNGAGFWTQAVWQSDYYVLLHCP